MQAVQGNLSGGSAVTRETFTTNGSGAATVAALIGKTVDLWTYENGTQGVLLGTGDYTFNSGTGAFSGLDASKKYLAYGY